MDMEEPVKTETNSNEETTLNETQPDRYEISILALRTETRRVLSALLNPPKIILTDGGLQRDWHGLAQLVGIAGEKIPLLQYGPDYTKDILSLWYQTEKEGATIRKLLLYLEKLERFDVIDDVRQSLENDVKIFEQNGKVNESSGVEMDCDKDILTRDDLERIEEGLEPQKYDAFVLFADDDIDFATQLIDKLENQYRLRLCVKDRDLVVGVFVHDGVIRLIAERCHKLIVIISPAFLGSSSNKFFCQFAQTIGMEQRQRKIIPCLYTPCQIPTELNGYFILDYKRAGMWNFWERLRNDIRPAECAPKKLNIYRSASQKIPHSAQSNTLKPCNYLDNFLKPKNERVKFSSMVNLNYSDNDALIDQNLNPSCSATSLTGVTTEHKKSKTKIGWLKKILSHKTDKCMGNVIDNSSDHHKKGFLTKHITRKMAVAN